LPDEHCRRIKTLIAEALELVPGERVEFLSKLTDTDLREEVESLLAVVDDSLFGKTPVPVKSVETDGSTMIQPPASASHTPHRIGPYRVLREIGEGGMGTVYEAEQISPVRRKVALKLIKWGMDTKAVVARFESERQALALMNHPCIASVHDAGSTDEGRPYFAMEYVPGIPITDYCDKHRLSIPDRLELFIQVCDGLQHAHQKGIIHRDIKPSNVLVAAPDDRPLPKIIDFGVAKAVSQRLTEHSVFTELGQLVGTPEYMSPEQAEMTNLDIDTRTDVYSLGVLLFELLVGTKPFESSTLRNEGLAEIQRVLREEDPPTPSSKVRNFAGGLGDSARARRLDVKSLEKKLKGDLDWIVMKAMEKDRTHRYETANAFALDVRRFLENEPVRARAPSTAYRLSKFVRRNRGGVIAATGVASAIIAGLLVAMVGMVRARRAEQVATAQAAKATAINEFMQEALGAANPQEGIGRDVTLLDALAKATEKLESSFEAQPEVEAAVRSNIGLTYLRLGRYDEAAPLLESALKMQEALHGHEQLDVAETLTRVSSLYFEQGDYGRAEATMRESLDIRRRLLGEDDLLVAQCLDNLGLDVSYGKADFAAAEDLHRRALSVRLDHLDEADEPVLRNMNNLAMALYRQQKYGEAERLFRRAIELTRSEDVPDLDLTLHNNLVLLLRDVGRLAEASMVFAEVVEGRRALLGENHPEIANTLNNLGALQVRMGEFHKAEASHREALAIAEKVFGEDHFVTGTTKSLLASALMEQGRLEEAETLLLEAYRDIRKDFADDHPRTQATIRRLVLLYKKSGKEEKARYYEALLK
jgi:eukaryotic-like serine/threonine-protein kinase